MKLLFNPTLLLLAVVVLYSPNGSSAERAAAPNAGTAVGKIAIQLPTDSPTSSHPVERAVATGSILDERLESVSDGAVKRTRLLRSDIQSHLLRVEEEWTAENSTNQWTCRRRDMFLADQLIINVRAQTSPAALRESLAELNMELDSLVATQIQSKIPAL
jgi:hypothetical protein